MYTALLTGVPHRSAPLFSLSAYRLVVRSGALRGIVLAVALALLSAAALTEL